jgi:MbtH protein
MPSAQDSLPYAVVVNDEQQYSIWPTGRDLPAGWRPDGCTGTEDECLAHIEETWTDMRPASLRRWMRDHERAGAD